MGFQALEYVVWANMVGRFIFEVLSGFSGEVVVLRVRK
jgi:hypothetical protein